MTAKIAARVILLIAMTSVLHACGGGSSSTHTETTASPSHAQTSAFDGTHQWKVHTVATDVATISPSSPFPLSFYTGGSASTLIWASPSDGQMTLNTVDPSTTGSWQTVQTLMSGLPTSLQKAQRQVVRAGAWTLVVWSPPGSTSLSIYARLVGPGVDSGTVEIAHDLFMVFDLWPVVSADGHARIYWADPDDHTTAFRHFGGHFEGPTWVQDSSIALNGTSDHLLVDADGQGWMQNWVGGGLLRVDAVTGIGSPQLPDATLASGSNLSLSRLVAPLPNGHLLFAEASNSISGATDCVQAIEVDAKLQPLDTGTCLNLLGPQTSTVGNALGISTDSSGQALLVWSGADDQQLYAAARSAQGKWTPLGMAASGIYNRVAFPFSPQTILGPNGRLAIVFSSEQGDAAYHPESMTYTLYAVQWDGKTWGPVELLTSYGASTESAIAAFDAAGNLGVLSIEKKDSSEAVRFSTMNGSNHRTDQLLESGLTFSSVTFLGRNFILPDLRLHTASDGSWIASWSSISSSGSVFTGATLR